MLKSTYILLALISSISIQTCIPKRHKKTSNTFETFYNVSYGPKKIQTLDLFIPKSLNKTTPLIILVHGGAWFFGKKESLHPIQEFLAKHNIASANINYSLNNGTITYETQLKDIDTALNYLKKHADSLKIPARFILFGESAGAHLSLLYGYRNPQLVEKIISLAAPTDFFSKNYRKKKLYHWYTKHFFELATGKNYPNEGKIPEEFKAASPIANTTNVPTLILQGTNDIIIDKSQAISLDSVLSKKEIPHKLVLINGGIHISRHIPMWRDSIIYPEILAFLKEENLLPFKLSKH